MSKNLILFILFLALLSQSAQATVGQDSNDGPINKGFRIPESTIEKDFTLMSLDLEEVYLSRYILKKNFKVSRLDAREIAQQVIKISSCFKVDPWLLTALIQKESSFKKDAVSATNAAGLTQFTTSGFKEVNDQLGLRGRAGAIEQTTLYFSGTIRGCINESWVDLWNRLNVPETDLLFYSSAKELIKKDLELAITYGAILLKTYVAAIDVKMQRLETPISLSETYYQALQVYNGEPGDAKVKYAKNIFLNLQNMYPRKVKFSFSNAP